MELKTHHSTLRMSYRSHSPLRRVGESINAEEWTSQKPRVGSEQKVHEVLPDSRVECRPSSGRCYSSRTFLISDATGSVLIEVTKVPAQLYGSRSYVKLSVRKARFPSCVPVHLELATSQDGLNYVALDAFVISKSFPCRGGAFLQLLRRRRTFLWSLHRSNTTSYLLKRAAGPTPAKNSGPFTDGHQTS